MTFYNTLMNILLKNKNVRVVNHEIEDFLAYCNEHNVHPSGGAYSFNKYGKVYGQYFYI